MIFFKAAFVLIRHLEQYPVGFFLSLEIIGDLFRAAIRLVLSDRRCVAHKTAGLP